MIALLGQVLIALSLAGLTFALLSVEVREPLKRGFRGLVRESSREKGLFRAFDYGVRLSAVGLGSVIDAQKIANKDEELTCSGELWGFDAREFYGVLMVFALASLLVSCGLYFICDCPKSLALGFFLAGSFLPGMQLRSQRKIRQVSIERALPFVLDLIYMTMGAGMNLQQALIRVVDNLPDRKSPMRFELKRLIYELRIGTSLVDAMKNFSKRVQTETASDFAHWVIQSEEKGSSLRSIFQKQASSLRQKRSVMAEESASKAGAALMLPMTMMFGVVMIIVLTPLIMKMKGMDL